MQSHVILAEAKNALKLWIYKNPILLLVIQSKQGCSLYILTINMMPRKLLGPILQHVWLSTSLTQLWAIVGRQNKCQVEDSWQGLKCQKVCWLFVYLCFSPEAGKNNLTLKNRKISSPAFQCLPYRTEMQNLNEFPFSIKNFSVEAVNM